MTLYDISNTVGQPRLQRLRWMKLVNIFQSRAFYRAGDPIFALRAISCAFARAAQKDPATNHFGLWEEWLLQDLLWHSEHSKKNTYAGLHSCPSWSWISVCPEKNATLFKVEWSLELQDEWDSYPETSSEIRTPKFKNFWTAQVAGIYSFKESIPEPLSFWGSHRVIRLQSPLMPALLTPRSTPRGRFDPNRFELSLALSDAAWGFVGKPNIILNLDDVNASCQENQTIAVVVAILRCHVFPQPHVPPWTHELSEAHGLVLRADTEGLRYRRIGRVTIHGEIVDFLANPGLYTSGWLWEEIGRPGPYLGYATQSIQTYGHLEYALV